MTVSQLEKTPSRRWLLFRFVIGGLLIGGFIIASLFRSIGWFIHDIYWLQEDLGGSEITHFLMGSAIMFAAILIFTMGKGFRQLWWTLLGVSVFLAVEEFSHWFLPTREFNWWDLGMGLAGAAVVFCTVFAAAWLRGSAEKG